MSGLAIALLAAVALIGWTALVFLVAAAIGRRPNDRRAAREWRDFQASMRRHPSSPRARCVVVDLNITTDTSQFRKALEDVEREWERAMRQRLTAPARREP